MSAVCVLARVPETTRIKDLIAWILPRYCDDGVVYPGHPAFPSPELCAERRARAANVCGLAHAYAARLVVADWKPGMAKYFIDIKCAGASA